MKGKKPNVADCQFCEHFRMEKTGYKKRSRMYICGFSLGPKGGRLYIGVISECPKSKEEEDRCR